MSIFIYIHLSSIIAAVILLVYILLAKKGSKNHLIIGRAWVVLMLISAYSSFFIRTYHDGNFSFIHLFSLSTIFSIILGISAIRNKNIRSHKGAMLGLSFGGIGVAGYFAIFTPGRLLYNLFFG